MITMFQRRLLAILVSLVTVISTAHAEASAPLTSPEDRQSGYALINGLKMYYEVTGVGRPAVYIHPVLSHCGLVRKLPKDRQWITMDLQGHDAPSTKLPLGTFTTGYYPGVTR